MDQNTELEIVVSSLTLSLTQLLYAKHCQCSSEISLHCSFFSHPLLKFSLLQVFLSLTWTIASAS